MRVNFNQTTQINNTSATQFSRTKRDNLTTPKFGVHFAEKPQQDTFQSVSFGKRIPDEIFLLNQVSNSLKKPGTLRGIYSRRELINPFHVKTIYGELSKKSNAQAVVKYLKEYVKYMFDVEAAVYNMFKESEYNGAHGCKALLENAKPQSVERMTQKQIYILDQTKDAIEEYPAAVAKDILNLRDTAMSEIAKGTFDRSFLLERLRYITSMSENAFELPEIYKLWYRLPNAMKDYDAFVVKYSAETVEHDEIARRLISSSVATTEHLIPTSRHGENKGGNMAVEAQIINNTRSSMRLGPFSELHPELNVEANIQKYINDFVREINRGNEGFVRRSWYPEAIQNQISIETGGEFIPSIGEINISKAQRKQNDYSARLGTKYRVFHK